MVDWFLGLRAIEQAALAGLFTWGMTALGAATILPVRTTNQRFMDLMLGFTAGIMLAASYFSLLAPAIAMAEERGITPWVPAVGGFLLGAGFVRLADMMIPHVHPRMESATVEGVPTEWRRSTLMLTAMTIHNIPEGLAVGVAFGAAAMGGEGATVAGAVALTLGIGMQNFPEGAAVSFPLRRAGMSRGRAFMWGQSSAVVELFAAVIGAAVVVMAAPILPWALSFAAGAMVFVVLEEVVPESHRHGQSDEAALGAVLGFAIMMALDVGLG